MLLNNRIYDIGKQIAQIWLPALGTLYFALAGIWHLPNADNVTGTVVAVDTFLGVVLGISSRSYNNSDDRFDGELKVEPGEDGDTLRLANVDLTSLTTKSEITFKVTKPPVGEISGPVTGTKAA